MTYFVTGATGFIGRHLVGNLLKRKGTIHVLVRKGSQKKLDDLIDHGSDSVRYYRLCRACVAEVEWIGGGEPPAADTYRIV